MSKLTPAVKKETIKVAVATAIGVVLMLVVFAVLHHMMPEKVPFDYTVVLGGLGGGVVAVLNFFLMGLTVQKVVDTEDEALARSRMRASYTQRLMMQVLWMVLAFVVPVFHPVAGIVPLLFPSLGIKIMAALGMMK